MIRVFNTLTEKKEEFKPLNDKTVKMYVCGPTVYDHAHIGHARSAIVFDVIRRWFEYRGYRVIYVRNYTDVDDKIIKRSKEEGIPWYEVAKKYIESYEEDMKALNIKEPTYKPKVTEHIEEIIEMIKGLIAKGYAYESEGDVYFSVEKFSEYGKLSKRKTEELIAGARIEPGEKKKNPLDFALWKKSKEGEPGWESPWGIGRPGWHIECSAMAMKYLGRTMDIHGGGLDLIFPHHENEIAQSEAYTGKSFVRYWLHNGFVMVNKEKMSKSLGNFFTIKDILKEFSSDVLRLFLLSTHYRSPIDFSFERLKDAERSFGRLLNFIESKEIIEKLPTFEKNSEIFDVENYKLQFESAMDDDFNTARALGVIFELVKEANLIKDKAIKENKISNKEKETILKAIGIVESYLKLLGFKLEKKKQEGIEDELIKLLIDVRSELRKRKAFDLADKIRDGLKDLGIILEDLPSGTIYKRSN
ncbi:cysteinyl-tRNA synthetase [Desulfurobacterium thermolithotrophum DSM 11699]|uniref:Cysteine--tRNA ligase n=1 Tax=Desulfurobacterium thermolithotrophum (strain DSM 11699 / BSA) TaxID=868864 RepID=F0S182_DESTD|nr:cysteine--tRNA ligase [Desulfurobacterium thermolithotrophum]ADY73960.1 cysteinyl-tRNA synthetase [Desulfurobacterium thermolithotrophum DSM 11699]